MLLRVTTILSKIQLRPQTGIADAIFPHDTTHIGMGFSSLAGLDEYGVIAATG